MKTVNSLEDLNSLPKLVTIKKKKKLVTPLIGNETKEGRNQFLGMQLGTLGTNLSGNMRRERSDQGRQRAQ